MIIFNTHFTAQKRRTINQPQEAKTLKITRVGNGLLYLTPRVRIATWYGAITTGPKRFKPVNLYIALISEIWRCELSVEGFL